MVEAGIAEETKDQKEPAKPSEHADKPAPAQPDAKEQPSAQPAKENASQPA